MNNNFLIIKKANLLRIFGFGVLILFFFAAWQNLAVAQTTGATGCGSADQYTSTELLKDASFSNGIQSWDSPYPFAQTCQTNWTNRIATLKDTPWKLIEVGEKMLFCNQDNNPSNGAQIIYANPMDRGASAGSKQIVDYKNASDGINMIFNSSQEWRGGCSLTKNDELNGNAKPVYAANNGAWDWQHLLLDQKIIDLSDANNRLMVNKYNKLTFNVTLKVDSSAKMSSPYYVNGDCPEWKNHALFYVGVVLDDATHIDDIARRMYVIFPAWQTYDGNNYFKSGPWLGDDPASAKVYFTGMVGPGAKYEPAALGQERSYSIDLQELAAEGIGGYNQKRAAGIPSWNIDNYAISDIYIGWEIWGGYDTNVTIKNLSLEAYAYTNHLCSALNRYWNPAIADHYYTTDYIPQGFMGYNYEGPAAVMPTINMPGTAKLWRYWNPAVGDHYYSTNLQPFGLGGGGWALERQAGSIFTSNPGNGYEPFDEWWCGDNTDHLYQLESAPAPIPCYSGQNTIGWLKKPCVPGQISGCQICNASGTAWSDDNSKCVAGQTCQNGGCKSNSTCITKTCLSLNYNCGTAADGCSGKLNCGTCASNQTCTNNLCVANCAAKTCASLGYTCGSQSDGCDSTLNCGTCASGKTCSAGVCIATGMGGGGSSGGGGGGLAATTTTTTTATSRGNQSSGGGAASPTREAKANQGKMTRAEILAAIARIQALIADLQKQLAAMAGFSCTSITKNLFYGMANDTQVKCLQEVLKSQGYTLTVSGNYDAATKTAVAQFQQKYAGEILTPYHLTRGSGNVGNATLAKINQILKSK